ncbi:glycosyltransferase family 4 protein [Marinobacter panjinensis]|uniref:Glycosyltransferase family 4 protein n=2 Tax=Marinobacter panjinensis TaxID=2576384 RepID=A0A4U6R1I7_9GAMM|nr:glycosyltransferase family 4 protein [Marinobacter panjinensis]MCR8915749.1 glycosyltransferase family 4 protein [Marinobacter panjinensis]TKV67269.1 glycosyltransferase family 4 protein [Marinobacter panjinensis]
MRFCMVTTFYPPYNFGGDGIFVRELAVSLVRLGHSVRVIHCEDAYRLGSNTSDPGLPRRYDDEGVQVCRLKSSLGALSPLLTQQLGHPALKAGAISDLLNDDFDVINYHNISLVGGPAILSLGEAPVKLYTLHEHWLVCATHIFWKNGVKRCDSRQCLQCCLRSGVPPQFWRYTGLARRHLEQIDCLIAPSQFTANQHKQLYPGVPTRIVPLYSRLAPSREMTGNWSRNDPPRFVYSGRITASKGVESVLEQFTALEEYELVLAGDGDALPQLRERFAHYPNIHFTGRLYEASLIELYSSATALIFPSIAPETFGLTAVEAMACGTPAIVRDSGGCAEIIETTKAGFVYKEDSELPALLHRMVRQTGLREQLSELAVNAVQRFYTRQRYLNDYLAVIEELRGF